MRNTTNLLILNLAVADLLFILVCVPATASDYVLMHWPFGLTLCRTVQYIIYVTAYVSIYTLVLMAGDRSDSPPLILSTFHGGLHLIIGSKTSKKWP